MTVAASTREVTYVGDGGTLAFAFTFPVHASSEVKVQSIVTATGAATDVTSSVTIALTARSTGQTAYPGGTVTFSTAPASTVTIRIYAVSPATQAADIGQNQTWDAAGFEEALDALERQHQELARDVSKLPVSSNPLNTGFEIPAPDTAGYMYSDASSWSIVSGVTLPTLTLTGQAATRIPYRNTSADDLKFSANLTYDDTTNTLTANGSSTASDKTQVWKNSSGTEVASIRSDGAVSANTSLATKLYVDNAVSSFSGVLTTALTGFSSGAGTVSAADTVLSAFNKLDGNITALGSPVKNLARSASNTTVYNTAVETTIMTISVPGGTLGTNKRIRGKMVINSYASGGGFSDVCTFKLKYDGAVVGTVTENKNNASGGVVLVFELMGDGTTGAQLGLMQITDSFNNKNYTDSASSAKDSTTTLDLTMTAQWGQASSSNTLTATYYSADVDT